MRRPSWTEYNKRLPAMSRPTQLPFMDVITYRFEGTQGEKCGSQMPDKDLLSNYRLIRSVAAGISDSRSGPCTGSRWSECRKRFKDRSNLSKGAVARPDSLEIPIRAS